MDTRIENQQSPPADAGDLPVVRLKRPLRSVSAVVVLALVLGMLYSLATNPNMEWPVIGRYLFDDRILQGVVVTIELTVIAMVIGIAGGVLLSLMRTSSNRVLRGVSAGYIWLFRGTPLLVQILFAYNLASLYPHIGIPFVPALQVSANDVISPWAAALLALSLNEAAYMAEIVRGVLLSIPVGQREAASALGM
jgi:polar amino acid transport system permease protein